MSKDRKDFADFSQPDTLIGKEVVAEGTLSCEGDVQINGQFKGEVNSAQDLIIGEHARVVGNLSATNVYIAGEVDGDIQAAERLEILETGRVNGDVSSQAMSIEPGGILKGSSSMEETAEQAPTAQPTYEVEEEKEG